MRHCSKCNCQLNKEPYLTEDGWMCYDCPQCHFSHYVPVTQPHYTPEFRPQDKEGNGNIYIIIFSVCIGISIALASPISVIFFIGALVAIVTGFIKHPRNRAIKVLFWLTIALMILSVIATIILIITCINACADCYNSCMNCG